jgi:HEAT repeat protein
MTSLEAIAAQLDAPDFGQRIQALIKLRAIEAADAVPLLAKALKDPNPRVRYSAVSLLGQKHSPETLALLQEALATDPEFDVRAAAAAALGDLGDRSALDNLVEAYRVDRDEMVRFSAVAALGELGDERAIDLLADAIQQGGLIETAAVMALGQITSARTYELLAPFAASESWEMRFRVAQALKISSDERAIALLKQLQADPHPQVAQEATLSLEEKDPTH